MYKSVREMHMNIDTNMDLAIDVYIYIGRKRLAQSFITCFVRNAWRELHIVWGGWGRKKRERHRKSGTGEVVVYDVI